MYTLITPSLLRAKERAANAGSEADEFLSELLEISKAPDIDGTIHYRPYYCAATYLEQSPQFQQLSQAGDVKFTQMRDAIASLKATQAAYDARYQLIIPYSMDVKRLKQVIPFNTKSIRTTRESL